MPHRTVAVLDQGLKCRLVAVGCCICSLCRGADLASSGVARATVLVLVLDRKLAIWAGSRYCVAVKERNAATSDQSDKLPAMERDEKRDSQGDGSEGSNGDVDRSADHADKQPAATALGSDVAEASVAEESVAEESVAEASVAEASAAEASVAEESAAGGAEMGDERLDYPAWGIEDLAADVDALRLRLDDQGAVLRRVHSAVSALADSLGKVVAGQRRRERFFSLNSFVAYALFTLLLGGAFFLLYSNRAGELLSARERAVLERDEVGAQLDKLVRAKDETARASQRAFDFYQLMRDGHHAQVIAQYPSIAGDELTATEAALFAAGMESAKAALAQAHFRSGVDAFDGGNWDRARGELRTALNHASDDGRIRGIRYYLGRTYLQTKLYGDAVRELELATVGASERDGTLPDARFFLAQALENAGQTERAHAEYGRYLKGQPRGPLAVAARRQVFILSRQLSAPPRPQGRPTLIQ